MLNVGMVVTGPAVACPARGPHTETQRNAGTTGDAHHDQLLPLLYLFGNLGEKQKVPWVRMRMWNLQEGVATRTEGRQADL